MTRTRKWLVGIAVCLLLLVTAVYFFDWNLVRPYIARQVSSSTGRSFAINGDLEVHLSLRPRIIMSDVTMGNAAWSKEPVMAQIRRADFKIDLLKILIGRLSFPEISLSDIHLLLEVNDDGTPNWVFGKQDKQSELPSIDALAIDHGSVEFRDPTTNTDLALELHTITATKDDPEFMVEVTGVGQFKGMETKLEASGGALLTLSNSVRPYPIKVTVALGTTQASIDGTLIDPLHFNNEEVNFRLEGSDLALMYPIAGVPLPPTPAYKLAGYLSHSGNIWTFKRFKGTVGKSDLTGDFSVDTGKTPQLITADVVSLVLDMNDLGGFIGANSAAKTSSKVLPTQPFNLDKLRAADADVRFKGAKIVTKKLPIDKMEAHLTVKDGALKLDPLNFGIARGELVTVITMDGRKSHLITHADITARGLYLNLLFPESKLNDSSEGTLGGRATLDTSGNSIAQMMGSANGKAALIMDGGTISELLLRMSNLDIANSFLLLLGGDKQAPVRCMVANFKAVAGDFQVQDLVLDTPNVNITGEGNVNFTDESLHLKLVSQSKGFSVASLRGPIMVTGSFKNPKVEPDMGKVVARGGLAVGLGAVTAGIGALIPLVEFGKKKDSNCTALMVQAKSDAGIRQSDIKPHRLNDR